MAEKKYIELEAVLSELDEWYEMYPESDVAREALALAKSAIRKIPAADVAPVRHGRWIEQPHDFDLCGVAYYQCSVCGKEQQTPSNYCQFCGAKMDMDGDCNDAASR